MSDQSDPNPVDPTPEDPQPEAVPKRRRTRAKADGQPEADAPPAFAPQVTKVNAIAKRKVRTGQYEDFEISMMIEGGPDPHYSNTENLRMFGLAAAQEVNEIAEAVQRQIQAGV